MKKLKKATMSEQKLDINDYSDYRQFLEDYFAMKKKSDRNWTLSVWAQLLELNSVATLSMILTRKRHAGKKLVERLITYFQLNHDQAEYFREIVKLQKAAKGDKKLTQIMIESSKDDVNPEELDMVFNWESYAVRELTKLKEFKEDPDWITKALNFNLNEEYLPKLIERMLSSSFLERKDDGELFASHNSISPTKPIEKKAAKKFHRDLLDLSHQAFNIPLDRRTFTHTTLSIKKENLKKAKEMIREFQINFTKLLEDTEGDDIVHLNIQFYPITKK
ncbi:MAG: TIGR02147 family protein [Bacteriovoracaceae bacterium]